MTSSTSPASTPARESSSRMTTAPNSWAGVVAKEPLKEPTGVRAALATTMEADMMFSGHFEMGQEGLKGSSVLALSGTRVKPETGKTGQPGHPRKMLRSIFADLSPGQNFRTAQTAWNRAGFAHILEASCDRNRLLTQLPVSGGGY